MNNEVFTDKEAQALLKLSRVELYRQRKAGKLGFCKIGTRILYRRKHIDAFLNQSESVPESVQASSAKR